MASFSFWKFWMEGWATRWWTIALMIDSMLDTEPHLSVHQSNVFYLLVGLLILCVYCMKTFSLLNIFVPYWQYMICSWACLGMRTMTVSLWSRNSYCLAHLSGLSLRLCHCVAFTKPVWECIHVWESLTYFYFQFQITYWVLCVQFFVCFVSCFLADCCINSLIWNVQSDLACWTDTWHWMMG